MSHLPIESRELDFMHVLRGYTDTGRQNRVAHIHFAPRGLRTGLNRTQQNRAAHLHFAPWSAGVLPYANVVLVLLIRERKLAIASLCCHDLEIKYSKSAI